MTPDKRICISGGHIWPGNNSALREGGVLITGNRVSAILTPGEAQQVALAADEVIDAKGMLIMPPLISAHVHSTSTLLRGTENAFPLELWSYYAINYGLGFAEDAIRSAVLLTSAEMIRNGIGGYVDHFPQTRFAATGLHAHRESGLRIGFAPFFADLRDEDIMNLPLDRQVLQHIAPLSPRGGAESRATYAELDRQIRWAGDQRITLLAGPNSPQRCSDELWQLWRDLQEGLGIGSHTHLLETFPQAGAARQRWPKGVVQAMDDADLLHERLSVAHGIWLDDKERELLARRGVTLSFNPISNGMLGSGRKSVRTELDAGINVALGTDCSNTGGRHDLFEVMRHMLISGRDPGTDFDRWVTPAEALSAATASGAAALGSPQAKGRLEAGNAADILVLCLDSAGLAASPKDLNSVVVHADPRNVHALMVDGKWLLRDNVIKAFDEAAVIENASRHAADLRAIAVENTSRIKGLHQAYQAWQQGVFLPHACPSCGGSS